MTATPTTADAKAQLAARDLTLDLARVFCVLLVIAVHLMFVGVEYAPDGSLLIERTLEEQPWFEAATWFGNVMPLFFVIGGFASAAGSKRHEQCGGTNDSFIRSRLVRLAAPSLPLFVFCSAAAGVTGLIGLDPALVGMIIAGAGVPLWFLAAYVIAQSLAPAMLALHRRVPVRTLAALIAAVAAVDAIRFLTETPAVGIANTVFVWLAVQQVGFWMHDGWFLSRRAPTLALLIALGYGVLTALVAAAPYSVDMLSNQYQPTMPMVVLGVIQAAGLTMLRRPLAKLMETRPVRAVVWLAGSRLTTLYLWHMPVILALTGVQLLAPMLLFDPGSATWWLTRIPFYLAVLATLWLMSLWLVRFERGLSGAGAALRPSRGVTVAAVVLFAVGPMLIAEFGLTGALAAASTVATLTALWLVRDRPAPAVSGEARPGS